MSLNIVDLVVIAAYLAGVTAFGLRFRSSQRSLKDYFLAGNTIPWWAISLSIVAAETSTLTVISVPGLAYDKDFRFLQLALGYIVGRVVVSYILIPHYFTGTLVTAYQLIDRRFGGQLRSLTAGLFLLTRAAAEGVRVFAVAIVVRIALGSLLTGLSDYQRDLAAIAVVSLLTLAYTFRGGMAAVIWTDVLQLAIYATGSIVAAFSILHQIPGGWQTIQLVASGADKFRMLDLSLNLSSTYTIWSGVIGGAFLTTASHGTDQLIVQRLLSARNQQQAKAALVMSGIIVFGMFALFLLIGVMLFVFYMEHSPSSVFSRTDAVFPTYIVAQMPTGMKGLLISAILAAAMSNLSAALNSLSSTTIVDFYARLAPASTEQRRLRLARWATLGWGCALFGLALLARHGGKAVEMALSIASVAYGSLLGAFLLGVLTRRASQHGAMVGMIAGFAFNVYLWLSTTVSFTWYVAFGSVITFVIGYAASYVFPRTDAEPVIA